MLQPYVNSMTATHVIFTIKVKLEVQGSCHFSGTSTFAQFGRECCHLLQTKVAIINHCSLNHCYFTAFVVVIAD